MTPPTIGQQVFYKLSQYDADQINVRRGDADAFRRNLVGPLDSGKPGRTGHIEHTGNSASEGQMFPAFVVACWGGPRANLHVLLDGNDTYWATSRTEGTGPGEWLPIAAEGAVLAVDSADLINHSRSHEAVRPPE